MTLNRQEGVNEDHPIHALSEIISPLRLGTYLNAAGHNPDRAMALYLWNAQIGEAFHLPIQSVEVGLRNRVSDGLANVYGYEWWKSQDFLDVAHHRQTDAIDATKRRIQSKNLRLETGQIIAGLSFGFWVAMIGGRYNPPIWGAQLRTAFPHLPNTISRDQLHRRMGDIADFRNRLWHHEPIFRRSLMDEYSRIMAALGWLSPVKAQWIRPHCRVPAVMRERP